MKPDNLPEIGSGGSYIFDKESDNQFLDPLAFNSFSNPEHIFPLSSVDYESLPPAPSSSPILRGDSPFFDNREFLFQELESLLLNDQSSGGSFKRSPAFYIEADKISSAQSLENIIVEQLEGRDKDAIMATDNENNDLSMTDPSDQNDDSEFSGCPLVKSAIFYFKQGRR